METLKAIQERFDKELEDIKISYKYYSSLIENRGRELNDDMKELVGKNLDYVNDNFEEIKDKSELYVKKAENSADAKKEEIRLDVEAGIKDMQKSLKELDRKVGDSLRYDT